MRSLIEKRKKRVIFKSRIDGDLEGGPIGKGCRTQDLLSGLAATLPRPKT